MPARATAFLVMLLAAKSAAQTSLSDPSVRYAVPDSGHVTLRAGGVEAVIVDNRAVDDATLKGHRAGYSGVASLTHEKRRQNLFVPAVAGLNFEHIHDGTSHPRDVLYEPRRFPMELRAVDDRTAELYQGPTPNWGLESCQRFRLLDDGTIELTIECVPRKTGAFRNGYVGLFWASYIDKPESTAIHFLGRAADEPRDAPPRWVEATSRAHGIDATHRAADDGRTLPHDADFPMTLVFNESNWRYAEPWYFGVSHGMAFAQLFRRADQVRFAQSPSGGGNGNPAWDFQFFIPDPTVGQTYRFTMRAAYVPYTTADELRKSVERHVRELTSNGRH